MNKAFHILSAQNGFAAILVLAAILLGFMAPKAAVNVDEQLHYPHAKKVVNWYFTLGEDRSCLDTPKSNLKYYGQSVDNLTALINRVFSIENEFLLRHYAGAFFFWLLLLFSGMIARKVTGSYQVATITVLTLLLMPRLFGQAFGNLKDIPFATGYTAGVFMIIKFLKEMPRPRWRTAVFLGLAIAFTVSVRAGGFILFGYLALCIFTFLFWKPFYLNSVSTKPVFVRLTGQVTVILFIGYFAGLLFWPFALQNVFSHPLESLNLMEHYSVNIRQIFEGELTWSAQLPWYYVPKWLLISTPEFIMVGLLFSLFFVVREFIDRKYSCENCLYTIFILFVFVFPVVYVIAIGSNLYSGIRQMLFVLPFVGILAAIGIWKFVKWLAGNNKKLFFPSITILIALAFLPVKHQAATFPAGYVYFNSISGGNKKAWSNYEYDYYFHGIKQPADYLINLAGNDDIKVVMNCNLTNYFSTYPNIEVGYSRYLERSSTDWDYAIFGINYIHPHLLKNYKWQTTEVIKTFYHKGNPLAVVLKRVDKNDFYGIEAVEKGNFTEGQELIKSSLQNNLNNVWLYVQLAKANLLAGNASEFKKYLNEGKTIHPFYEPLFMLEAQYYYNEGQYVKSMNILKELVEINPLYPNAQALKNDIENKKLH
ncbi:hypothetical protein SAMN05444280_101172 [Tangfeifania diversioriginum]|uniref:Uncharacterized protein n=1 Tax=Tangfeifania diversioriginum TaxID=1168035 RepID=A0A1M6AEJ3_9BACT|nr:hypothetical protein [Tangfeifania diversioriginum]SHI34718.1 hypothetical protein SAMN05444280_101172 [Tangfeifania diversioriginum]